MKVRKQKVNMIIKNLLVIFVKESLMKCMLGVCLQWVKEGGGEEMGNFGYSLFLFLKNVIAKKKEKQR